MQPPTPTPTPQPPMATPTTPGQRAPGRGASRAPAHPATQAAGGRHVLVIEDDAGIRELLADTLRSQGYAVTAMESALGATTLVRRLNPRVILLDLGLPYRSGGALLLDLKADPATAEIPVLVVSALAESLTPERRAMAAAVIAKPFNPDTLLSAVHDACASATN
jgi:CheY-like chemotaxis protein